MKEGSVRTLVQIHYHNRCGGVSTVISGFSNAFNRLFSKKELTKNILICNSAKRNSVNQDLFSIRECDYHFFRSKRVFSETRKKLYSKISSLINNRTVPGPVCVIFHNPTLGKNLALSAAVYDCAEYFLKKKEDISFFWMIHDFAEEGRVPMVSSIKDLEKKGVKIRSLIYPSIQNVHYLVNNKRNFDILQRAGAKPILIQNPFSEKRTRSIGKGRGYQINGIKESLTILAGSQGKPFFKERPVFLYPVRVVPRKNIPEAVLIACLFLKGNLLLGKPGRGSAAEKTGREINDLCVKYGLPVVFNSDIITGCNQGNRGQVEGINRNLYSISECSVSTSVAEGYGYTFYDSWINNRGVIGRVPMGFKSFYGLEMDYMYRELPVPVRWVSMERLARLYFYRMKSIYNSASGLKKLSDFRKLFFKTHIKSDMIDFSILDIKDQLSILKRIAEKRYNDEDVEDAVSIVQRQYEIVNMKKEKGKELVEKNRLIVEQGPASRERFDAQFFRCLGSAENHPGRCIKNSVVSMYFNDISNFRAVLS